ncbi:hypothetical protein PENSPDRAFT_694245 [Peniophora sp. CONT]|nr:hypothetical protein PENSPDRAFT_694245 [Peniophora sp. CONT]
MAAIVDESFDGERIGSLELVVRQAGPSIDRSAIGRLNDDVLRIIFRELARVDPARLGDLGWIKISHISRRWRTIVLAMPLLWARTSFISLREPAWETVVDRSQDLPLFLRFDDAGRHLAYKHLRFASSLFTRSLVLLCRANKRWGPDWQWDRELSGRTLVHLRQLWVASRPEDNLPFLDMKPLMAPNLRFCHLSSDLPVVAPNLISLTLRGSDSKVVPLSRLLPFLESFPHLIDLSLEDKHIHVDDLSTGVHVSLHKLRNMFIETTRPTEIPTLLEHLQFPLSTSFYASFMLPETGPECTSLVRALRDQLLENSRSTLQIFRSSDSFAPAVQVGSPQECSQSSTRGISLCCASPPHFDALPDARLIALFRVIRPLADIIASRISSVAVKDVVAGDHRFVQDPITVGRPFLSRAATAGLSSCLQPFRSVTSLRVSNRARSFLLVLGPEFSDPGDILFPLLDTLVFDVNYKYPKHGNDRVYPRCHHTTYTGRVVKELAAVLESRLLAGHRLRQLVLTGARKCTSIPLWMSEACMHVDEGEIKELESLVETFSDERR